MEMLTNEIGTRPLEAAVATRWFSRAKIQRAFGITKAEASDLCDYTTDRAPDGTTSRRTFDGGYGCNILDKQTGSNFAARKNAARKLAEVA